jgi:hypothetical protein
MIATDPIPQLDRLRAKQEIERVIDTVRSMDRPAQLACAKKLREEALRREHAKLPHAHALREADRTIRGWGR